MTISSRTPDSPNRCPICKTDICLEPLHPGGDAPCPSCGTLLWFHKGTSGTRIYVSEKTHVVRKKLADILSKYLKLDADRIIDPTSVRGLDSLDYVEIVMDVEEVFP